MAYLDLSLKTHEKIFGGTKENSMIEVIIDKIDDFPEHPFLVKKDEALEQLVESIKEYGLINPPIVRRKEDGRYEMISGHRRKLACKMAGMEKIPVFVRDMDKDTAVLLMVDSNMQREKMLPSEKAFSYKMKLEALKSQGKRTDLTSAQLVPKLEARDIVAKEAGTNRMEVTRYIRLTNLTHELLQLVDDGRIALNPAIELSYLTTEQQQNLFETIQSEDCTPSLAQAKKFREWSEHGLNMDAIYSILTDKKPNQEEVLKFKVSEMERFFPIGFTQKQMHEEIIELLENRQRNRNSYRDER
jgi:ParB family chromosome partitioning protein